MNFRNIKIEIIMTSSCVKNHRGISRATTHRYFSSIVTNLSSDKVLQIKPRKTRSSDLVSEWSTTKQMNRDLQPNNAKKRPVAEVTPSKMR